MSSSLYTADNPLFSAYLFYCAILVLKVLFMAYLTIIRHERSKRKYPSSEDATSKTKDKVIDVDSDLERVKRAHLNDLENIPVFMVTALLYIATNPAYFLAVNLFRIFTIARFIHSFVYAIVVIPQPTRGIAWAAGYAATIYMAVQVILFSL